MANSHKRDTNARFKKPKAVLIAGPLAVLATAAAVTGGVVASDPASLSTSVSAVDTGALVDRSAAEREGTVSRSTSRLSSRPTGKAAGKADTQKPLKIVEGERIAEVTPADTMMAPAAVQKAVAGATTKMWTTEDLNLWTRPDDAASQTGTIAAGKQVLVTGRSLGEREEIVVDGESRWVTAGYLDDEEPAAAALGGECTNGSSVPDGVHEGIKLVHQAVCANWPEITSYGTFRSDGEHGEGRAIDIMVSGETGWDIAEFLRENYADLDIEYIIYSQQIWSVERSGEGWRGMEDRGSTTANHYDHVHVTVY